jgi:hypothetical protein
MTQERDDAGNEQRIVLVDWGSFAAKEGEEQFLSPTGFRKMRRAMEKLRDFEPGFYFVQTFCSNENPANQCANTAITYFKDIAVTRKSEKLNPRHLSRSDLGVTLERIIGEHCDGDILMFSSGFIKALLELNLVDESVLPITPVVCQVSGGKIISAEVIQ